MLNGIGFSRRDFFRPIAARYEGSRTMPSLPKSPAPDQPVPAKGWTAIGDISERIKESLPKSSSGNADVDFALVAAPVIEALVDLAAERATSSNDKAIVALSKKISAEYVADLQALINFLEAKGQGGQ
jgi:hypothetical protein